MKDCFLLQNNFLENENEDNYYNMNSSFHNDESPMYFQNMKLFNQEMSNEYNNNNIDMYNIFPLEEEDINKEISLSSQSNIKENIEESNDKILDNNNIENQSLLKINEINNKNKIKIDNENKNNNNTGKKRKQRIHLEDLNIDPEIIKCKRYQTIGDKVITSKNTKITELDKKEIRAIRNRISAQKSRDKKKAEFNELQMKVKFYEELTKKQNLMIKDFERISCEECRTKFMEIKLNRALEKTSGDKEYLVLDEDNSFISSEKKTSSITKLTGVLITLVCLICITLCYVQGGFYNSITNTNELNNINKLNEKITLRQLNEEKIVDINNDENNEINEEKVLLPINNALLDNNININELQLYHDRFGTEIYTYLKKKNKARNGFLMNKQLYNQTESSVCIETKNIEHNNYIIDNNSIKNTLPVETGNIIIDNNLSHKIISLFVKDYNTLNRYINGKSLTLQEQIEIEAKNSEDGCVYLQMIIPNYGNDENNNSFNSEYKNSFFEIRCKIFAYNNYYESKLATTTTY